MLKIFAVPRRYDSGVMASSTTERGFGMKRRLTLMLAVLLSLLLVLGCGSNGGTTTDKGSGDSGVVVSNVSGKVRVIVAGGQLENGVDPISGKKTMGLKQFFDQEFSKKYPNIKIELSVAPWENADAKMRSLLISKDIDVLASGGFEHKYYAAGLLRSIDDLLAKDPAFKPANLYISGLWENSVFNKTLDGVRFGLPTTLGQRMVIYDKKLFDDWGVPYLSERPTPEEILEKAKKMTGKNPKTGEMNYGLYFAGNNLAGSLFTTLTFAFDAPGFQGDLKDHKNINWQLDTPNMAKVMNWLGEAAKLAHPAFVNNKGNENFGTDKNVNAINLEMNGAKIISDYKGSGKKDMIQRFVPTLNLGPKGEGWVANDSITMAKEPQNLEAAWEVMKFMGGYDYQKYNYEMFGNAPTLKNPDFLNPDDVYLQKALKIAEVGHTSLHDSVGEYFSSELNPAVNGFISSAATGKTPDVAAFLKQQQDKAKNWSSLLK